MVVTAGAVHGQAKEGLADRTEHVLQLLLADLELQDRAGRAVPGLVVRAGDQEARGGDSLSGGVGQHVACDLLAHKLVVGLVRVQATDDVVPVGPGVVADRVALEPLRLREARHVEPVPAPSLAVAGIGQHAVHQPGVGVRRAIVDECVYLGGRWRNAEHVERHAANECRAVGGRRGAQMVALQVRQHEGVDGIGYPGPVLDGRHCHRPELLQRPPVWSGALSLWSRLARRRLGLPDRAARDPAPERIYLRRGERLAGRHLPGGDLLEDQALLRIAEEFQAS